MLACNNSKNIETRIASCAQLLIKHGVNVNAFDKKRRTAIMMAANNGHAPTVELLLPLVDRDAEDNQRWDVLFWAVSGNHPMIVSFLLSQGFTCDKVDIRGNTVADLAQSNSSDAILKLLPKDPMDNFYLALNTSSTFEDTFGSLKNGEKYSTHSTLPLFICLLQTALHQRHLQDSLRHQKRERVGDSVGEKRRPVRIVGDQRHKTDTTRGALPLPAPPDSLGVVQVAQTPLPSQIHTVRQPESLVHVSGRPVARWR
jgi:ankyrin repeat protein